MKRRIPILLSLTILSVTALLAGCSEGKKYEWHVKHSIEVQTPSSFVSGSSVVRLGFLDRRDSPQFGSGNVYSLAQRGEAIVVDLGSTPKGPQYLFALSVSERQNTKIMQTFGLALDVSKNKFGDIAPKIDNSIGPIKVALDQYPMLVIFDDINDPTTVKEVDPNDLAATFGAGYELKSVALEISDEPITEGRVNKVLVWLETLEGGYLHGGSTSKGSPFGLYGGVFKSGKIND